MEKKIIKIFSIVLSCFLVVTMVLLLGIDDIHGKSEVLAKDIKEKRENKEMLAKIVSEEEEKASEIEAFSKKGQIRITLPEGITPDSVTIDEDVLDRTVTVAIPGADSQYLENDPIMGSAGRIDDLDAYTNGGKAYFEIELNGIYAPIKTAEDGYVYLDFANPHDVYENVVVIDAGHGGKDVGAVEKDTYEKDIDLNIVLKLKELLDQDPTIKAYYTRLEDDNPSLEERVGLANDVMADVFLSVHNNSISGFGAKTTSGTQVLYYASDPTMLSLEFADICLEKLCDTLRSANRGLVNGDDIYIIHNSKSPVALVEVGFLSNPEDLLKLNDSYYQGQCAKALYESIKEMINKTYKE